MTDFVAEIPVRALINAAVIDRAVATEAFAECVRSTLEQAGFAPDLRYQFKNPAFIVGFLYCLVVVPKEIWLTSKDDPMYRTLDERELHKLFTLTIRDSSFDNHPSYEHMRHLRNAVAHARFSIDETQAFTFWDHPNGKPRVWEAQISNENLMTFLSLLAHVVVFLRDDPQRTATSSMVKQKSN